MPGSHLAHCTRACGCAASAGSARCRANGRSAGPVVTHPSARSGKAALARDTVGQIAFTSAGHVLLVPDWWCWGSSVSGAQCTASTYSSDDPFVGLRRRSSPSGEWHRQCMQLQVCVAVNESMLRLPPPITASMYPQTRSSRTAQLSLTPTVIRCVSCRRCSAHFTLVPHPHTHRYPRSNWNLSSHQLSLYAPSR